MASTGLGGTTKNTTVTAPVISNGGWTATPAAPAPAPTRTPAPVKTTAPAAPAATAPTPVNPANGYTAIIQSTLKQWGLESLAPIVDQLGRTGASNDEINLKLQDTKEWKQRFAGNQARIDAGLAPLDPATYVALEGQYRQVMSQLPRGFYDSKADIDNFIGGDVSPSELADRVQLANQAYITAPQESRDAWDAYYGHAGASGAVAAILDHSVAEPLIQQKVTAAGIGSAALQQGLALTDAGFATQAAQRGVTIDDARKAYSDIAQRLNADQAAGSRFGDNFGQQDEERAALLGDATALQRQRTLYAEEKTQFASTGQAGPGANSPGANY